MTTQKTPLGAEAAPQRPNSLQSTIRNVGRRQWWLWSTAVITTILLTVGIASFAFPGLLGQPQDEFYSFAFDQAVRSLVGLVLVFIVYAMYQQWQIRRMQLALNDQLDALDAMAARTDEVYNIALLDSLTGLHNRRCGEQRLSSEMARALRNGLPLGIIMLDLDNLKFVNDKYGHAAGDELLQYFASRLNKAIRGSDVAIRLGGDEFMLILPECKPNDVQHVLDRLANLRTEVAGHEVSVIFSAGTTSHRPGETLQDFTKRADEALYVSKRAAKQPEEHTLTSV